MKKHCLHIILFLVFINNYLFAQTYTTSSQTDSMKIIIEQVFDDMKNFYQQLDHTSMQTNLLFNYGFLILNDLEECHDSIPISTNLNKWQYIYNAINHSVLNGVYGLPNDTLLIKDNSISEKYASSSVGLSFLYFKGDYLPDTAIKTLINNNDFSNPPYEIMKIFAGTTNLQKSYDKTVIYSYKPDLLFSNQKEKIIQILINFEDGTGYKQIDINTPQTFSVTYNCIGEKSIRFKLITTENDTLISYSKIDIITLKNIIPNFEGYISIADTNSFNIFQQNKDNPDITLTSAYYNYYEGCDSTLDKPVIIAEGFDVAGNMDADYLHDKWSSTIDNLRMRGYDVFCVNFNNPTSSLLDNAQIIKTLIKGINTAKQHHLEGIYIGESMGGILGRIALKQLENEFYDHQFGLYVSYDAPHKGAYVPEGIQFTLQDIAESLPTLMTLSYVIGMIQDVFGLNVSPLSIYYTYSSIGARQLLARHIQPGAYFDYFDIQNYLDELGFPSKCRNISFANGSNTATTQSDVGPGGSIYNRTIILGVYNINFKAWYTEHQPQNQKVAATTVVKWVWKWWCLCPLPEYHHFNHKITASSNMPFVDAPGGFIDGTTPAIFPSNSSDYRFTFVPTVSAIDINRTIFNTGNFSYFNDFGTNNTANLIMQGITPFDDIYVTRNNSFHTDQIWSITDAIENDEVMYGNMYLQNKIINQNRDFEAKTSINIGFGNDWTPLQSDIYYLNNNSWNYSHNHIKNIDNGNVIVKSGTNLNIKAGNSITLFPGFETEPGATFVAEIGDICSGTKSLEINLPTPVIQGSFKVCGESMYKVENIENNVIEWKLTGENIFVTTFGSEFTTPSNLPLGQYTLTCTSISQQGEATSTRIINVICKPEIKQREKLPIEKNNDEVIVYPNPSNGLYFITIVSNGIENKQIKVQILDMLSNNIYSEEVLYNNRLIINCSEKPDGLYILKLTFNGIEHSKKLIKY